MNEKMVIVTAADIGYEQHTAVMLSSLFKNTANTNFKIYLLCAAFNKEQGILKKFVKRNGHELEVVKINEAQIASFKLSHHVSLATYFRLFIPEIVPAEMDKILYLDSDMVILGDLKPLWKTNITGYAAAAVAEEQFNRHNELGLMPGAVYYNAGVLLMNLTVLRELNFTNRAFEFANNYSDKIVFWDQDVINYLLQGKIYSLQKSWNLVGYQYSPTDELPQILHFAGSVKPWNFPQKNGMDKYYFKYLLMTPWFYKCFINRHYLMQLNPFSINQ